MSWPFPTSVPVISFVSWRWVCSINWRCPQLADTRRRSRRGSWTNAFRRAHRLQISWGSSQNEILKSTRSRFLVGRETPVDMTGADWTSGRLWRMMSSKMFEIVLKIWSRCAVEMLQFRCFKSLNSCFLIHKPFIKTILNKHFAMRSSFCIYLGFHLSLN